MPTDFLVLLSPKNIIFFIIVFTRLSGMVASVPLLSTYPIPVQVKVWFMATVAFIMFPIVMMKTALVMPSTMPELFVILLKEFIIGFAVGFVTNVVFIGVTMSANLVSMQMGLTAAQAMDPSTGETSPVFSQAYTIIASLVFIGINAYQWILDALFRTFEIFPAGYGFFVGKQFVHNYAAITSQIFTIGLSISIPIFSVLFITDVLLGFTAKMMPRMNIFMIALPAKIYIGLTLFILLIPQLYTYLAKTFENYLKAVIMILGG